MVHRSLPDVVSWQQSAIPFVDADDENSKTLDMSGVKTTSPTFRAATSRGSLQPQAPFLTPAVAAIQCHCFHGIRKLRPLCGFRLMPTEYIVLNKIFECLLNDMQSPHEQYTNYVGTTSWQSCGSCKRFGFCFFFCVE